MIVASTLTSVYSVGLIAVDRFLYIIHGIQYQQWVYPMRARLLIVGTWVVGESNNPIKNETKPFIFRLRYRIHAVVRVVRRYRKRKNLLVHPVGTPRPDTANRPSWNPSNPDSRRALLDHSLPRSQKNRTPPGLGQQQKRHQFVYQQSENVSRSRTGCTNRRDKLQEAKYFRQDIHEESVDQRQNAEQVEGHQSGLVYDGKLPGYLVSLFYNQRYLRLPVRKYRQQKM
jgi:hypothetical protein